MGYILKTELHADLLVNDEPRPRWNGGLIPSADASDAFHEAVDAFMEVMRRHGYRGHYGYGATARPTGEPE
jgi:hypothetical protein